MVLAPVPIRALILAVLALAAAAAPAYAAPPANDGPDGAAAFSPITAENGRPAEQQGIAELAEATADPGVPRCFGPGSFARTVWFVVPATDAPQEINVEATGQTLDVLDLAAFVQPEGATSPSTSQPNVCAGVGSGGADASQEPNAGVTLRVPPRRAVLIQVGRRGPVRSADDERAIVSLDTSTFSTPAAPLPGDAANPFTPAAHATKPTSVPLFGATITGEDPAEPPCPSLGDVWRRLVPTTSGPKLISVGGGDAETFTVFSGPLPSADTVLDCVNRSGRGAMEMVVPTKAKKQLWIRIGTDAPPDQSSATIEVGPPTFVADGGPGGSDPTSGGPGGGLPYACGRADAERASISGPRFAFSAHRLNRDGLVPVKVNLKNGPVCDVSIQLVGPRGRVYAAKRQLELKGGKRTVRLARTRAFAKGGYRLRVTGLARDGLPSEVRSTLRGKLV